MRTNFVTPEKYANAFLEIARNTDCTSGPKPVNFIRKMEENRGSVRMKALFGDTEDGLEPKNPLIVALGDSVTAGHFEAVGDLATIFRELEEGKRSERDPIEITDARECYLERFRMKLIDRFEQTSVSTINSGIAGDTIIGMQRRLYRDVIRYQPDLIILNASLNWGTDCGTIEDYARVYRQVVMAMKRETYADIVLLTPNMDIPGAFSNHEVPLIQRVNAVREIAAREGVSLVDVYSLWEDYAAAGYPMDALLANGVNHPSTVGHEVYAMALMQLIEGQV